jgi:hypothetical protein
VQIAQGMTAEAIVASVHAVFSRPMARVCHTIALPRTHNDAHHDNAQAWVKVAAAAGVVAPASVQNAASNAKHVRYTPLGQQLPVPCATFLTLHSTYRRCGCTAQHFTAHTSSQLLQPLLKARAAALALVHAQAISR